jgi:hypothetical protein
MSARKVRQSLVEILDELIASASFAERSDRKWVLATRANLAFALGHPEEGEVHERAFLAEDLAEWEIATQVCADQGPPPRDHARQSRPRAGAALGAQSPHRAVDRR